MLKLNREYLEKEYGKERLIIKTILKLKEININKIDSNAFEGLNKLKELSLEKNQIEELPVHLFQYLSNLKVLYLSHNRLAHLDSNVFAKTTKLVILELSDNLLESLSPSIFANLLNLKELDLHSNHLKQIDSNLFKGLKRLQELELNDNEIENIDVGSFDDLGKLKLLKLNNNKLKIIDRKCFEPLRAIHVIQLYENNCTYGSYFLSMTDLEIWGFDKEKLDEYGFRYEWEDFLEQFPKIEPKSELELVQEEMNQIKLENKQLHEELEKSKKGKDVETQKQQTQTKNSAKSMQTEKSKQEKQEISEKPSNSNGNNKTGTTTTANSSQDIIPDPYIGAEFHKNRYKVVKPLGGGTFGNVYLVTDLHLKTLKALKIMHKNCSSSEKETYFLSKLDHQNIIRYFDHFIQQISDTNIMFIVTEFCECGDLKKQIDNEKAKENGKIPEKSIAKWMYQATEGLKYLHEQKIIHRDIKPANMLLKENGMLKLADLGVAKWLEDTVGRTMIGTKPYMSPELYKCEQNKETYSFPTDIWSLGCVLYELKYLKQAFPEGQAKDPAIPNDMDDSLYSILIKIMLVKLPSDRIETQQLYVHLMALNSIYELEKRIRDELIRLR